MGSNDKRLRPPCSSARAGALGDDPPASLRTVVLVDALRDTVGRADPASGVAAALPSWRGIGESRRTDRAEAVR